MNGSPVHDLMILQQQWNKQYDALGAALQTRKAKLQSGDYAGKAGRQVLQSQCDQLKAEQLRILAHLNDVPGALQQGPATCQMVIDLAATEPSKISPQFAQQMIEDYFNSPPKPPPAGDDPLTSPPHPGGEPLTPAQVEKLLGNPGRTPGIDPMPPPKPQLTGGEALTPAEIQHFFGPAPGSDMPPAVTAADAPGSFGGYHNTPPPTPDTPAPPGVFNPQPMPGPDGQPAHEYPQPTDTPPPPGSGAATSSATAGAGGSGGLSLGTIVGAAAGLLAVGGAIAVGATQFAGSGGASTPATVQPANPAPPAAPAPNAGGAPAPAPAPASPSAVPLDIAGNYDGTVNGANCTAPTCYVTVAKGSDPTGAGAGQAGSLTLTLTAMNWQPAFNGVASTVDETIGPMNASITQDGTVSGSGQTTVADTTPGGGGTSSGDYTVSGTVTNPTGGSPSYNLTMDVAGTTYALTGSRA